MQIYMQPNTVTNEILYNLLVDFKNDVSRRFDEQERRFQELYVRMVKLEIRMDNLEVRMENLETRVGNLETRMDKFDTNGGKLRIKFSTIGAIFNVLIAALVGGTVTFILNDR